MIAKGIFIAANLSLKLIQKFPELILNTSSRHQPEQNYGQ